MTACKLMLLLCLLSCLNQARAASWLVDSVNSSAWFEIAYWGRGTVKGRLALQSGRVAFDSEARQAQGEIGFDMNSVQTGREFIDNFIKSRSIFDTASYPDMRFRTQRLEFAGPRLLAAEGELQLRGVTRPVRLEVRRFHCADDLAQLERNPQPAENGERNVCQIEFSATIQRSQFGMDAYSMLVNDDVAIVANLIMQKIAP